MARVPEAELARIKREVDLSELVGRSGVALTRRGQDLVGLCPFHADTEPSLVVSPAKNLWHCLGACQAGGSVIDWVMRFEGISFRKAVELLRRDYAPSVEALTETPVKHSLAMKFDALASPEAGDAELLGRVIDFYHRTLLESPEALAYLEQRGLSSREAIERFRLGYANRTLGYRIPQRQWKEGRELRDRLQALGVLPRERPRALRRLAWWSRSSTAAAGWWRSTAGRSARPGQAARRSISTCRARTAASSTWRRSRPRRR